MTLDWFDATEAKKFGFQLADLFIERVAPGASLKMSNSQMKQKIGALDYKISQQIRAFKDQNKLNIYKTAQIGTTFKQTLEEAGYDSGYVSELTRWLMLKIKIIS